MSANLSSFYDYVDSHADEYVSRLSTAVGIKSVSADPTCRPECLRMISHIREQMGQLDIETELRELGAQKSHPDMQLPPVVVGRLGRDDAKLTVGIYGHLDVQPAAVADGWDTEPFVLTEDANGKMAGRGTSDDKGPVLGWMWAIEAFKKLNLSLPVNLIFCLESMEESGSEGLQGVIERESAPGGYFESVDCWCITDTAWLGTEKHCIQYGLRGICYFLVEVSGLKRDLHSGRGGAVHEPMLELVRLLDSLQDPKTGQITIPGVVDLMKPITDEEKASYDKVDISVDTYKDEVFGADSIRSDAKVDVLEAIWRRPSLAIHGIEGAFSGSGCKTVIPAKVTGKFSIRLVDGMDPEKVEELVRHHMEKTFADLNTPNKLNVKNEHSAPSFVQDASDFNYMAGRAASEKIYGSPPDLVRSGGSIPVTLIFQSTGKSVLLLPVGRGDDGQHGPNEKLDKSNYLQGIKLVGTYLHELAAKGAQRPPPPPIGEPRTKRAKLCDLCKVNFVGCKCCI